MSSLIPAPDLDIRNEEQLAAEAIARVSGNLDVTRIDSQIESLRKLRDLVAGGTLTTPACPELTNANPSSPHTVLLETQGWLLAQIARRINQLPVRDQIEFARLFGSTIRSATKATTTLEFISDGVEEVIIQEKTEVSTVDGEIIFATTADLTIPAGETTGTVSAQRNVTGSTLLAPNTLTHLIDDLHLLSVTNPDFIDSGSEDETLEEALARARNYQRRGERLVSARDVEDAVREEVLDGVGIVRAFPFIKAGDFSEKHAGYTTLVVMTRNGNAVSDETKAAIRTMLKQAIGSQFIDLLDPQYVDFNIEANVKIIGLNPQTTILAAAEANLRSFYAASSGNFGRSILRAEIIAVIEGTSGVDRIQSDPGGPILASPVVDVALAPYQIPRLGSVTLHVVQ
jgi:hypothetical protein